MLNRWAFIVVAIATALRSCLFIEAPLLPIGMKWATTADGYRLSEGKMTPEQIAEAQKLAREWKPK